jgi:predicted ArsR family transcriptional regulator
MISADILFYLKDSTPKTTKQIADDLMIVEDTVRITVLRMIKAKKIVRTKAPVEAYTRGPKTTYVYSLG